MGGAKAAPSADADKIPLTGLLVSGDPKEIHPRGAPTVQGVDVRVPFLNQPEIKSRLESFLGKMCTKDTRDAIIQEIVLFYRSQGREMVSVTMPPQEITGGVLQVLVMEGYLGRVKVEGARWFDSKYIADQLKARPGQTIDAWQLGADVDWLNRNPFRQINLIFTKGAEAGETDVVLREVDSFPLRFYGGYEDSGTQTTSNNRVLAGLNWGNVFGIDGQLNYQYMADPAFKWFRANSGSYVQPLPWRHIVTLFGSYADTHGNLPSPLEQTGFTEQASIRYEIPLPKLESAKLHYQHSIVLGFDFKRENNNLTFGGTQVFGGLTDGLQWSASYNSSLKDAWGETAPRVTLFVSPGAWDVNDTDAAYGQSRAGAPARYVYGNCELDRTTGLPWNFVLVNRGVLQWSDANLLASEQLGFGGYDTIRGYDTRIVNADDGYILNNELRTPPISLLPHLGLKKFDDKLQFLGFFDYGLAQNRDLLQGESRRQILSSVGPGLRYTISTHLSLRGDYGWQLHNTQTPRLYSSRSHLGLVVSF
jgi:hemolysin activation/secretion protein